MRQQLFIKIFELIISEMSQQFWRENLLIKISEWREISRFSVTPVLATIRSRKRSFCDDSISERPFNVFVTDTDNFFNTQKCLNLPTLDIHGCFLTLIRVGEAPWHECRPFDLGLLVLMIGGDS